MKIVATIEARMTSTRLPGKVLTPCENKPMLELMVERVRSVPEIDEIVIATTVNATDDPIVDLARRLSVGVWRGSEEDVLSRVLDAARSHNADVIVELTGDCPLIDPAIVSDVVKAYCGGGFDYVANIVERTFPIGMDTQVFSTKVLADVERRTKDPSDREHVSLYIYRHPEIYTLKNIAAPLALTRPDCRLTLDTPQDLEVIRAIFRALYNGGAAFSLEQMLQFLDANHDIAAINANVVHRYA